jgi:hypothetical protein
VTGFDDATALAATQHGRITRAQLAGCKVSRARIETLIRRQTLVRVAPSVYRVSGTPHTWEAQLHGIVLAQGERAVASHSSGAALWGFRYVERETFEVTTPEERRRMRGIRVHRTTSLADDDVTRREGIPVTTFERTLCDMTTQLSYLQLGRTLDDGLRRGVVGIAALQRCVERLGSGPNRRLSLIVPLIEQRCGSYDPGGSGSELKVLDVLRDAGLPLPVQQHRVRAEGRTYFLDYAYPERRVYIEYYGLPVHGTVTAVAYDSERLSALSGDGWHPLVFTDDTSPRAMVTRTARVLGVPVPGSGADARI